MSKGRLTSFGLRIIINPFIQDIRIGIEGNRILFHRCRERATFGERLSVLEKVRPTWSPGATSRSVSSALKNLSGVLKKAQFGWYHGFLRPNVDEGESFLCMENRK